MAQKRSKANLRRLATEIRRMDLGLTEFQRLCPYRLAEEHGVDVYSLEDLADAGCPPESITFFATERPEAWSAALVPDGTGRFIVENTTHNTQRRRSNVAHEMAHLLLEHEFDQILFAVDGKRCISATTQQMETEAAELGAELLLPAAAARRAALNGKSDAEVAAEFDVSIELARWRLNGTGARKIADRFAQKWRRSSAKA